MVRSVCVICESASDGHVLGRTDEMKMLIVAGVVAVVDTNEMWKILYRFIKPVARRHAEFQSTPEKHTWM